MKKVLHIFNLFLPKTEIWAYHLISATKDIDHRIFAKYYNDEGTDLGEEMTQYCLPENTLRLAYDATSKKDIIKKTSLWRRAKNLPSPIEQFKQVIADNDLDILHFHFGTTASEYIEEIESTKLNTIVSFYGWDYIKAPQTTPHLLDSYKRLFTSVDHVLVEGPAGKASLQKLGCVTDKIETLPLGIHKSNGAEPRIKTKSNNKIKLVQIASFSEKKGQLYSVKAVSQCLKSGLDVELTLVGDDRDPSYKAAVRKEIEDFSLNDKIEVISWIDFQQIDTFLDGFDAFIHPSCHAEDGDCEGGAPVIILKAQSCGLPIIATNHCDIPSQVIHEKTGLLTPEKNVDLLAGSIQRMCEMETESFQEMSHAAVTWVRSSFDYEVLGKRLQGFYNEKSLN